eukprot:Cvel_24833.t1-p1 / transcript=Cvel_24833.t1 / gene=Cvel_24833 / organism=Chromera_velia_CCMP2878 / gene_product=hypothetical protein / transcript_product=hypothetical protein / location=Cvel_scaffold2738:21974-24674(+) / protein_length=307 / sequence_SO=supercontig / SO=protein_coding / is_pseudo=false
MRGGKNPSPRRRSHEYLGCSFPDLKAHLEKNNFHGNPGMSWENYGSLWHVDHIVPIMFVGPDGRKPDMDTLISRLHFSNLQPMWSAENLRKGNRFVGKPPPIPHLADTVRQRRRMNPPPFKTPTEPHPLHTILGSSASSPNTEDLFDFILFIGPGGQSDSRTAPSFVAVQLAQRRVYMGVFAASRWQGDFEIVSGLIELGHFKGTEPQAVELAAVQWDIGLCSSCPPGVMDKHIVPHLDVVGGAASPVGISDLTGLSCFERGAGGLNGFSVFLQKVRGLGGRLDRRRKRKSREREGFSSVFELKGRA